MSNTNDNGPPTFQELLYEQSYGGSTPEPKESFDPGEHTVAEVEDYVAAHPDERVTVLAAEQAGKNRTTLVNQLGGECSLTSTRCGRILGTVSNVSNVLLAQDLEAAITAIQARNLMAGHWEHADVQKAVVMETCRLYKRRQSPEGVAGWGDLGVIRVASRDPDIEALLLPHLDMAQAGVA